MRNALLLALLLSAASPLFAQAASPADPCASATRASFDVVSAKPIEGNSGSSSINGTTDGMNIKGSLRRMMLYAFNLREFQLTGGPDWVATSVWEVHAKNDSPDSDYSKLSDAERKALTEKRMQQVQSILFDRFQLKCHTTTKELPIYELVQAKGGSKLKETTADEHQRNSSSSGGHNGQMHAKVTGVSMERIATLLAGEVDRMVVDKTGLTGSYDATLDWIHDNGVESQNNDAPSGPTIFTALEEQLGLKLVPAKGPVPVLVIDSVERPSEN